jgi:hypothetical protein
MKRPRIFSRDVVPLIENKKSLYKPNSLYYIFYNILTTLQNKLKDKER